MGKSLYDIVDLNEVKFLLLGVNYYVTHFVKMFLNSLKELLRYDKMLIINIQNLLCYLSLVFLQSFKVFGSHMCCLSLHL